MTFKNSLVLFLLWIGATVFANPVEKLIDRVAPGSLNQFELVLKSTKSKKDFFELQQQGDKIQIVGNNYISLATGFNWYLKYYANVHLSWNNMKVELPAKLPEVTHPERRETEQNLRYYLNYCTFSYSMPYWDWERWQTEIDWMALHGINLSLAITGTEQVWFNLLNRLGYTRPEIDQFISGPGYMAWWQMNNLEGWGGPNSDRWYVQQTKLQQQIIERMGEFGIDPVLPGYAGMLPHISGDKQGVSVTNPGKWCGFSRPAFLQPTDKDFAHIADMYYEELTKLYGKSNFYSIDPFHEGGSVEGVDLVLAGKSIMQAMKRTSPKATWVIQAWQANPRPAMIDPLDKGDLLILDLYSESRPMWGAQWSPWYREEGYGKHDWIFNMLLNFGGRTGMHGKMEHLITTYYDAKEHTSGKTLRGVGTTMEAIENNAVMFELLYELPWRSEKFRVDKWLKNYTIARYGRYNEQLFDGWKILKNTIYNCPEYSTQEGTTESIFAALPNLKIGNVSCCSTTRPYYNTDSVKLAADKFLSVAKLMRNQPNYEYDLVDLVRQTVANKAYYVHRDLVRAYEAKDVEEVKLKARAFLELLLVQDNLLATQPNFMLGNWVNQARRVGQTLADKDRNEWNARTIITVWGNRESAYMLHNYAYKEWSGVLKDVYYPRWRDFFTQLVLEMETGEKQPEIDYFAMDERWTRMTNPYPHWAQDDPVHTAIRVFDRYVK